MPEKGNEEREFIPEWRRRIEEKKRIVQEFMENLDDDTYTNEVGGYKAKGEAAAPATPVQAAQTAATQGAAPWKR